MSIRGYGEEGVCTSWYSAYWMKFKYFKGQRTDQHSGLLFFAGVAGPMPPQIESERRNLHHISPYPFYVFLSAVCDFIPTGNVDFNLPNNVCKARLDGDLNFFSLRGLYIIRCQAPAALRLIFILGALVLKLVLRHQKIKGLLGIPYSVLAICAQI